MAKRTVYICDGKECGSILVNPQDGFIIAGTIAAISLSDPKVLVTSVSDSEASEVSLCRDRLEKALGLTQ